MLYLDDHVTKAGLPIEGLSFEPNSLRNLGHRDGWFTTKLLSSAGPLISDFVTHEASFRYSSYGIHIGQDDRLTFMGGDGKPIHGHLVDCREGSPTLHKHVDIAFSSSIARHLVIPRGVAHTFDNLERVVTRDEPVWHSSENNKHWNIDNDLISVSRDTAIEDFPIVRVNEHLLPDIVHQFQSRLSQNLLQSPKGYLARYLLTIGGQEQYVMFNYSTWGEHEEREVLALLNVPTVPGVEVRRSRYALTGPRSWTIVPNTDACVADVLFLPSASCRDSAKALHRRTQMLYTFLNSEGIPLELEFLDCRRDSPAYGTRSRITTLCDPRFTIVIDHGVAYSIKCQESVIVRAEQNLFVAQDEPRADLPIFGQDLFFVDEGLIPSFENLPSMLCPSEVSRLIAKNETVAFAHSV